MQTGTPVEQFRYTPQSSHMQCVELLQTIIPIVSTRFLTAGPLRLTILQLFFLLLRLFRHEDDDQKNRDVRSVRA